MVIGTSFFNSFQVFPYKESYNYKQQNRQLKQHFFFLLWQQQLHFELLGSKQFQNIFEDNNKNTKLTPKHSNYSWLGTNFQCNGGLLTSDKGDMF